MQKNNLFDEKFIEKYSVNESGYSVWNVYEKKDGNPVIIQVSDSSDPPRWYIQNGNSSLFFLSIKEVEEYIKKHSLKLVRNYKPKVKSEKK